MGTVYRALDLRKQEADDRMPFIAIKLLNETFRNHRDSFITLQREARKAQSLAHPNIITVYDFDRDGPLIFMTMELLSGSSLEKILGEENNLLMPKNEALRIIKDVGRALAYAHENGIVHCDLKPANIIITSNGRTKVIDFGIARAVRKTEDAGAEVTRFDVGTLGALTPAYASPEMVTGEEPDPRDDIYGLACITYEIFTGKHPFNRISSIHAMARGLQPTKIKGFNRKQWRGLQRALAFERKLRIPTVAEFLDEIIPTPRQFSNLAGAIGAGTVVVGLVVGGIVYLELQGAPQRAEPEIVAQRKAEEAARLETQRKAEEAARLETQRKTEEAARLETQRKAEEGAQLETQRKTEEAARLETQRKTEEAARLETQRKTEEAARLETQRKAEEAARLETQRKTEEAARLETQRKAEEAARLETQRKTEEAARLETQRKAEEAARLETQRKAEEAARLETQRKAEEAARLETQRKTEEAAQLETQRKAEEAARLDTQRKAARLASARRKRRPGWRRSARRKRRPGWRRSARRRGVREAGRWTRTARSSKRCGFLAITRARSMAASGPVSGLRSCSFVHTREELRQVRSPRASARPCWIWRGAFPYCSIVRPPRREASAQPRSRAVRNATPVRGGLRLGRGKRLIQQKPRTGMRSRPWTARRRRSPIWARSLPAVRGRRTARIHKVLVCFGGRLPPAVSRLLCMT